MMKDGDDLTMRLLEEILAFNKNFVNKKEYEGYKVGKYPNKKLVIISCMDSRLVELLQKSMNVENGDAKIIKTAGALVSHPFGGVMRSILIAIYELGAQEVCVVGHYDCGMASLDVDVTIKKMVDRGINEDIIQTLQSSGIDLVNFLEGFDEVEDSVRHSVNTILNHPLIPRDIPVHGLVIDPETGKLNLVVDGYNKEQCEKINENLQTKALDIPD